MRIVRGSDPGPVTKHVEYKPHLQPLFRYRCAYCISHEDVMGGYDAMEVDHFRPVGRSDFAHLKKEWTNLYYSCRLCNGSKSAHWPTTEQNAIGFRFIDPCEEDPDDHISIVGFFGNGGGFKVRDLTPAGKYSIDKIRLNRKQLLDIRRVFARREYEARNELEQKRAQIEGLTNDVKERGSTRKVAALLRSLTEEEQRILGRMEALRSRRPFLVDEASGPTADQ